MAAIKSTFVAVVFIATAIPATKLDNSEDIGVSASQCNGAEVELNHGQLLMCYRNEWRGVCDGKKTFNKTDAEVVCYQLGLSGDVINTNFHCDPLDPTVFETVEFKDVSCTGREEELHDCSMNTSVGIYDCIAEDCICFQCPEESQVRLFNMTNGADYQGRVQHYYDGGWNELCVEGDWTDSNSHVVCQQLGMGKPLRAATKVGPSYPTPRFISSDINCTGSEETIKKCKTHPWTLASQCLGNIPWVRCEGPLVTITSATSAGVNSITVEWSVGSRTQYYPVQTGYQVQVATGKVTSFATYQGRETRRATVQDLQSFTEYTIEVRAMMGEHGGPWSRSQPVKTGPGVMVQGLIAAICCLTICTACVLFGVPMLGISVVIWRRRRVARQNVEPGGRNNVPGQEGEPDGHEHGPENPEENNVPGQEGEPDGIEHGPENAEGNHVPGQEDGSDDEYHSAFSDKQRPLLSNRGNLEVARQNIEPGGRNNVPGQEGEPDGHEHGPENPEENNVPGQEGGSDDEYHSAVSDERRPLLSNRGNRNYGNLEILA